MVRTQLLALLVAVLAYYATAQVCSIPDSQLFVTPYSPSVGGTVGVPISQLNIDASADIRISQYSNFTWVVTQIPGGLTYTTLSDKYGIYVTGTPQRAGTYTMNVLLYYWDLAANQQRCSTQPINFNFKCSVPITVTPASISATAYSPANVQFVATGGSSTGYVFSASFNNPTNGVNLTAAGALVGSWSTPTPLSFFLTVVDDLNCNAILPYTINVDCPTITISPLSAMPTGLTTDYYNTSLSSSGGLAPYSYYNTELSLPSGLSLDPKGTVYGTPAGPTTTVFYVRSNDANNCPGDAELSIQIQCPTITFDAITNSTLVDKPYTSTVAASTGSAPYIYSLYINTDVDKRYTAGQLPPGLTLNGNTGVISGTPEATGTYQFDILAIDAKGCEQVHSYTIVVSCDVLSIGDIATTGVAASPYFGVLTTTGGTDSYTYTKTSGFFPASLSLLASGTLSGNLIETGIFNFTIQSMDIRGCTAHRDFSFDISCPTITSPALTNQGYASKSYSSFVQPSGGIAPYTLISYYGLPEGLGNDNNNFIFDGIPTVVGDFSVNVTVADVNGCTNTFYMPLTISCATFIFSGATTTATVDSTYESPVEVTSGSVGTVTYAANGTMPRGLSLSADGVIYGTPSQRGSFTFTVTATDANGCTGTITQEIIVNCDASTLSVDAQMAPGQTGVFYSSSFAASGSTHLPYTFSITEAQTAYYPYGVQTEVTGPFQGWNLCYLEDYNTPLLRGVVENIFTACGQPKYMMLACTQFGSTNWYSVAAGETAKIFNGGVTSNNGVQWFYNNDMEDDYGAWGYSTSNTVNFDGTCQSTNGTCWPITQSDVEPALGFSCGGINGLTSGWNRLVLVADEVHALSLDLETYTLFENGTILGLPNIAGDLGFELTVTDDAGCTASSDGILHIDCGRFYVEDLDTAQVTIFYTESLQFSGGSGSYTAVITGLPEGLTYDAEANVISGTPTTHGTYTLTIDITDTNPCTYSLTKTFVVLCPPNNLSDIPPVAQVGTTYLTRITFINMLPPLHFEAEGMLPYGLTLYRDGTIEGVPSLPGDYAFFVRLTQDSNNGCSERRLYEISVVCGPIDVSDISNNYILGDNVDQTFDSSNGIQHYAYTLGSGQLPDGLSLDINGHLNGTVTKAGFYRFSVHVQDTYGCVGDRHFVVAVTCIDSMALGPLPTSFMVGEPVSTAPTVLGGVAPYTFQLVLGTMPRGITLSSDGNITGNVTSVGTFVFQLGVRDNQGCVATEVYVMTVVAPPTAQHVDPPVATGNVEPTSTPTSTPVGAPVPTPVQAPVQPPVQAPTNSPAAVSGQSSIYSSIALAFSACLVVLISL